MEYEIKHLDTTQVIGILSKYATMQDAQQGLPQAWSNFNASDKPETLKAISNDKLQGFLGIVIPTENGMNYLIAVTSDKKSAAGLYPYTLPEGNYIVADAIGPLPYTLQKTTERLYNPDVLSDLGYQYRNAPGIELYPHGNTDADDYVAQVWVPIEN
ncbi:putative effector domain of transcriptional regulator [Staphylococcus piscifermentans]|uniref:AraC effector-binding domain-containing protein n=1 Tax=Staphylococcus piscifermentans TaxID=70258 RepID=A0A239U8P1_9STAP|nr:GyrI-like domain-containing protein [Staphylococcus piscifermentans]RTX83553.1 AraC family transcriptional regulator [Staphylococcus piscifermentans]GEP84247.1 hypothetical protein SPI02_08320 [Staphylococcus piscifermentans]SNV05454.1 putative effector domain of transcriptional regulator [Staphylococcus piscifermentans]